MFTIQFAAPSGRVFSVRATAQTLAKLKKNELQGVPCWNVNNKQGEKVNENHDLSGGIGRVPTQS